ncbi:hypothetical protein [Pseudosulfitobacter pseudonitzschiae]
MTAVKGKNTKPELAIRSALHRRGFRFRLHRKNLPGRPDLVFAGRGAVIFVHGVCSGSVQNPTLRNIFP